MLYKILPTPEEISEHPELAIVVALLTNLQLASFALLAAYPDLDVDSNPHSSRTEQEAYVYAMLSQTRALEAVVEEYLGSLQRLRFLEKPEPDGTQVPF